MTENSVVVKHTFLDLDGSGDDHQVGTRRRTRSISDFGVEYSEQKQEAKHDFSDDGSTTAADDIIRCSSTVDSASSGDKIFTEGDLTTDVSTEESSDDLLKNRWYPAAVSTTSASVPVCPVAMQGSPMPGAFSGQGNFTGPGTQMYLMSFAPNGAQVLMPVASAGLPVSQAGVSSWNSSMMANSVSSISSQPQPQPNSAIGSLEARAAALSAHAAEVRAAARRAKAAAAAARRHSTVGDQEEIVQNVINFEKVDCSSNATNTRMVPDDRTTLMLRNLPNNYTRSAVLEMLDSDGFSGTYCFVYVPTDFKNFTGFGYAFVGFCAHDDAARAKRHYQGFNRWKVPSQKTCDVAWSGPVQGLEQHTERYRNSPVMHPGVPDEYKPAVFANGVRAPFPAPTKRIRPPRLRHSIAGEVLVPSSQCEPQNTGRRPSRRTM